jgi:hypothetical protein
MTELFKGSRGQVGKSGAQFRSYFLSTIQVSKMTRQGLNKHVGVLSWFEDH